LVRTLRKNFEHISERSSERISEIFNKTTHNRILKYFWKFFRTFGHSCPNWQRKVFWTLSLFTEIFDNEKNRFWNDKYKSFRNVSEKILKRSLKKL
jgi:hypothetical protein